MKSQNSLSKLYQEYMDAKEPYVTRSTYLTYENTFKHVFRFLKLNYQISKDSQTDFQRYIAHRFKTSSIYQVRKDTINLNAFFKYWNIKIRLKKPTTPEKLPKYFLPEHLEKLFSTPCHNLLVYQMAVIARYTGMRLTEIMELRWSDIQNGNVILGNRNYITKSKRTRIIPIHPKLQELFDSMEKTSDRLFTIETKTPKNWMNGKFKVWLKSAGVPSHYSFHCLRHTVASQLVQSNVSIYTVATILGHSSVQTTQIYAKLNTNALNNAILKL